MSEIIINPINNNRPTEPSGILPKVPVQVAVDTSASQLTKLAVPAQEKTPPVQEKQPSQKSPEAEAEPIISNLANVSVQFRVDENTKDVTIFVIDKQTKEVIRSIPASDLSKMQAGELLKLTI